MSTEAEYAQAADPSTPLERLAEIAHLVPELRHVVAGNPSAYPDLLTWLGALGDPATDAVLAARAGALAAPPAAVVPPAPASIVAAVTPDPAPVAPPVPAPSVAPRRTPMSRRKRLTLIVAGAVAAAVIVTGSSIGIAAAAAQQALESARSSFQSTADSIASTRDDIEFARESAATLLAETPATAVADADTLAILTRAIAAADAADFSVPGIAATTSAIEAQTADLASRASDLDDILWALYDASDGVTASKHALVVQRVSPSATHVVVAQDGNGNRQRITVTIGSWVRGEDAELLDEAWRNVGGEGPMPLSANSNFTMQDGAIVFGTVSIENLTPDFPAENFASGQSWVYLSPVVPYDGWFTKWRSPADQGMGAVLQSRQYSSGVATDAVGGSNPLIRAAMESNRWGAAPFVIGIDTVFTPEHPGGNPLIDEIRFGLGVSFFANIVEGEQSFTVDRIW